MRKGCNINGIENKLQELKLLIYNTHADIITLLEIKLTPKVKTHKVHNLTTGRTDRLHKAGGGLLLWSIHSIDLSACGSPASFSVYPSSSSVNCCCVADGVEDSVFFSFGVLKYSVCSCKGCDGNCVFCLYCEAGSCRCSCMGSVSVSSCRFCMFVSCVHHVAVFNAAFYMTCSLVILVEDERGDHMEEAYYIKGHKSYTTYRNHTSIQCQFETVVPQRSVLSPTFTL